MPLIRVTEKKLAANRANALKSTGPRTAAGKAATRFNALQHGCRSREIVIPALGESLEDFQAFHSAILADLNPPSPLHASFAEEFIATFWLIRRTRRLQTRLEQEAAEKSAEQHQTTPALDPHTHLARELAQPSRLQRRYFSLSRQQNRLHNSAHRTLARFYNTPSFAPEPQTAHSQTIQPKSRLLSTAPIAAVLAIFAILLSTITPIAREVNQTTPTINGATIQPISRLFSTRSASPGKHPILSPRNSPVPATVKDLVSPVLVIG